ncbi:MAG: hypothetical protein NVSMB46_04290 [Candidatus Saccharimonadales bacterium]
MAILRQTELALSEMDSNRAFDAGTHNGMMLKAGGRGTNIGSVPFDPVKHSIADIDPFSMLEIATDIPQVRMRIPRRPLSFAVIIDKISSNDDVGLINAKQTLADDIRSSVIESIPDATDRYYSFVLSDKTDGSILGVDDEMIPFDENPLITTKNIQEFCRDALTFIISDFSELSLTTHPENKMADTIGVKINHAIELAVPESQQLVSWGGLHEANTYKKPKDLKRYNEALGRYHQSLTDGLIESGLQVANVSFSDEIGKLNSREYDYADNQMAGAIRAINNTRA